MNAAAASEIAAYRARRVALLTALDLDYARRLFPQARSDQVLLAALHKARYECLEIEPRLRHESRAWLEGHAYGRLNGLPWPPMGKLPS